jgi:hypothetical protein
LRERSTAAYGPLPGKGAHSDTIFEDVKGIRANISVNNKRNGVSSGVFKEFTLVKGQIYEFKFQDANSDEKWTAYFDGEAIRATPTMTFDSGKPETNDEVEDTCDSAWARFNLVNTLRSGGYGAPGNLVCSMDDNPSYHFDGDSDIQHYVRTGQPEGSGCAGAT